MTALPSFLEPAAAAADAALGTPSAAPANDGAATVGTTPASQPTAAQLPAKRRTWTKAPEPPNDPADIVDNTRWHGRHVSNQGATCTVVSANYVDPARPGRRVEIRHPTGRLSHPTMSSFLSDWARDAAQPVPSAPTPAAPSPPTPAAPVAVPEEPRAAAHFGVEVPQIRTGHGQANASGPVGSILRATRVRIEKTDPHGFAQLPTDVFKVVAVEPSEVAGVTLNMHCSRIAKEWPTVEPKIGTTLDQGTNGHAHPAAAGALTLDITKLGGATPADPPAQPSAAGLVYRGQIRLGEEQRLSSVMGLPRVEIYEHSPLSNGDLYKVGAPAASILHGFRWLTKEEIIARWPKVEETAEAAAPPAQDPAPAVPTVEATATTTAAETSKDPPPSTAPADAQPSFAERTSAMLTLAAAAGIKVNQLRLGAPNHVQRVRVSLVSGDGIVLEAARPCPPQVVGWVSSPMTISAVLEGWPDSDPDQAEDAAAPDMTPMAEADLATRIKDEIIIAIRDNGGTLVAWQALVVVCDKVAEASPANVLYYSDVLINLGVIRIAFRGGTTYWTTDVDSIDGLADIDSESRVLLSILPERERAEMIRLCMSYERMLAECGIDSTVNPINMLRRMLSTGPSKS